MGKRRVSNQQRQRIQARQERHVAHVKSQKELIEMTNDGDLHHGIVLANLGKTVEIETDDGQRLPCHIRQHLPTLVPGDRIVWKTGNREQGRVVVAMSSRNTELLRFNQRGEAKPMAANLNQLVIVLAPNPPPHWALIDRYIVLARHLQLTPVLVLNKIDLAFDDDMQMHLHDYEKLGLNIIKTSIMQNKGIAEFAAMLSEQSSTLVGQSGVGKSALAKTVLPVEDIHIAADEDNDAQTNETSRLGRHTTTTARLYHLENQQGDIIDSPGVRVMHMQGLSCQDITAGFQEIAQAAGHCQFRDCRHQQEAKCAVLAAVAAGEISTRRLQSYQALCAEVQTK